MIFFYRLLKSAAISFLILLACTYSYATEYFLSITIDEALNLSGSNSINFTNNSTESLKHILIQLPYNEGMSIDKRIDKARYDYSYPYGFEPSVLTIKKILINNQIAKFIYLDEKNTDIGSSGKRLYAQVNLKKKLLPGKSINIKVLFDTKIPHKYGNGKYNEVLYLQGMWYPSLAELKENGTFNKSDKHYSPSKYTVNISAPPETTVISAPKLNLTKSENHFIYSGKTINRISMLPIVASKKFKKLTGTYKDIQINSYYLPGEEKSASASVNIAKKALKYYETFFDMELPSKHLNIVENYMGGFSAYSSGNTIFMPRELRNTPALLKRLYEVVLVHEISHMWWGLEVSYGFDDSNWIGEGLSTFFMNRYFEYEYGKTQNLLDIPKKNSFPNYTYKELFTYLPYRSLAISNLDPPPATLRKNSDNLPALSTVQYQKGQYIFSIIYQELGDAKFIEWLKYLRQKYKYKTLDNKKLLSSLNYISGKNYSNFFENWVYDNKKFDYKLTSVKSYPNPSFNYTTTVRIKNNGSIKGKQIIQLEDRDDNIYTKTSRGLDDEIIEFNSKYPYKEIILDPKKTYPDISRIDNYYPQRYRLKPYLSIAESDAYYFFIEPSFVVSNLGSHTALKTSYGYLDDFSIALDLATEADYWNIQLMKNRFLGPNNKIFLLSNRLLGVESTYIGTSFYWYHTQEKIKYPGTFFEAVYATEDLYQYTINDQPVNLYGFYSYFNLLKTGNIKKIMFILSQKYGLTPLNNFSYSIRHDLNRKYLGSDWDFEQTQIQTNTSIRVGHLRSLNIMTKHLLSKDIIPNERNFYLYRPGNLRATPRSEDINRKDRNLGMARISYSFPIAANIYDTPFLSDQLWIKSTYFSLFYEMGSTAKSARLLYKNGIIKTWGIQFDVNLTAFTQFPFNLNLIWARPITNPDDKIQPTRFWLGFNGLF